MGRIDSPLLAAALCTLTACAHPSHTQPGTAYYRPAPAAPYTSPHASQPHQGHYSSSNSSPSAHTSPSQGSPSPSSSQSSGQNSSQSSNPTPGQSSQGLGPQEPEVAQAAPDTEEAPEVPDVSEAQTAPGARSGEPTHHHLAAASPGVAAGMPVETESGSPLGFVVDVLPGPAGTEESGYVVIVGSSDATTPVPYGAARSMVRDGSMVIDHARFTGAPKVKQSQIEDPAATAWKAKADTYWKGSTDAPGTHPGSKDSGGAGQPRMDFDPDTTSGPELHREPLPRH